MRVKLLYILTNVWCWQSFLTLAILLGVWWHLVVAERYTLSFSTFTIIWNASYSLCQYLSWFVAFYSSSSLRETTGPIKSIVLVTIKSIFY